MQCLFRYFFLSCIQDQSQHGNIWNILMCIWKINYLILKSIGMITKMLTFPLFVFILQGLLGVRTLFLSVLLLASRIFTESFSVKLKNTLFIYLTRTGFTGNRKNWHNYKDIIHPKMKMKNVFPNPKTKWEQNANTVWWQIVTILWFGKYLANLKHEFVRFHW